MLLKDGVCLRVPFNRVTIKKSKESSQPNDMLDFAGVSSVVGGVALFFSQHLKRKGD